MSRIKSHIRFISEFVRSPMRTGSIFPSSRFLAREMLRDINDADHIVEFGPGTGAITDHMIDRAKIYQGFELNKRFYDHLIKRYPDLKSFIHNENATNASRIVGVNNVDHVVSSIPFTSIPKDTAMLILNQGRTILKNNQDSTMRFFFYAHTYFLLKNRRFLDEVRKYYHIERIEVVLLNMPPAIVITLKTK